MIFKSDNVLGLDELNQLADQRPDCDVHSSSETYAKRFTGPLGKFFLDRQWELVKEGLPEGKALKILDVGGGHAQLVERLAGSEHSICVLGSSTVCSDRIRQWLDSGECTFTVGNFYDLPFPDKSFDVVVSLRQLAHLETHELFVKQLCRVAKERVILDYAPYRSFNILYPLLFWLKKYIEKGTRLFYIHNCSEIARCFKLYNFKIYAHKPQYFWPMGLHRAINNVSFTRGLESIMLRLGLTRIFGSPTLLIMTSTLL